MKFSLEGRADLVRVLAASEPSLRMALADFLGYEPSEAPWQDWTEESVEDQLRSPNRPLPDMLSTPLETGGEVLSRFAPADVVFWRAESLEEIDSISPEINEVADALLATTEFRQFDERHYSRLQVEETRFIPLVSRQLLLTRLRRVASRLIARQAIDTRQAIDRIARGEWLDRLPKLRHRVWGSGLYVIQDWSQRLMPFWFDQDFAYAALAQLVPKDAITLARVWESCPWPFVVHPLQRRGDLQIPPPGSTVLALTDLGQLDQASAAAKLSWERLGSRLRQRGIKTVALVPTRPDVFAERMTKCWTIMPWEKPSRLHRGCPADEAQKHQRCLSQRLMRLLAMAVRVEPGLLRSLRRLFSECRFDAGVESLAWQHPAMAEPHIVAATLDSGQADVLLEELDDEDPELVRRAHEMIYAWHMSLPEEIRLEEIFRLGRQRQHLLPDPTLYDYAEQWFKREIEQLPANWQDSPDFVSDRAWALRFTHRIPSTHWRQSQIRTQLVKLWRMASASTRRRDPPAAIDPVELTSDAPVSNIELVQVEASFAFQIAGRSNRVPPLQGCFPIGTIQLRNRQLRIDACADHGFWADDKPPPWASNWGIDKFGTWAEFQLDSPKTQSATPKLPVTQRMRWIAAGTFLMGSPEDEPGRYDDEGPQHHVTISRGFWIFDTPCTQALWEAVVGRNPSEFDSPTRPVENVSWEDCQQFLTRLRELVPGLEVELPTEAEWEYSCRAGTETATYGGPIEILGDANAPALDPVAWYGGNCGVEFDLPNGVEPTWLTDKQFDFEKGGTRPVALKLPNPWGLYDMLGNVHEWCADAWSDKHPGDSVTDPRNSGDASAERVVRGGSWLSGARVVRAASRYSYHPELRSLSIGFRCRVQSGEPSQQAAEPQWGTERAVGSRSGKAEPRGDSSPASDVERPVAPELASEVSVISGSEPLLGAQFLDALAAIPLSDLPRPTWASKLGRDDFGLWAEFQLGSLNSQHSTPNPPVTQRLRLIPPGTFLMGSPNDEVGRYDREGPQHSVTISHAFWMFDTPCTQALWQAVTGDNPSHFKGSNRPVEQVSWNNCQQFLSRMRELVPDLRVELPSEAEWEYACRADTTTATYVGDLTIDGDQAVELESVAWYWGNRKGGTKPVCQKQPNPWGLYDTLGNVREWCLDEMRQYKVTAIIDPSGPTGASAERVVRGGSWDNDARRVRAAYRDSYRPESRDSSIGFRCRVQARELQQAVGRASARRRSERSREDSRATSAARSTWINLIDRDSDQTRIPQTSRVRIVTDLEELTLCQTAKPGWAAAIGRDRFGLWVEFELPREADSDEMISSTPRAKRGAITQRLRWIPPGRFLMGSPQDEPGRWEAEFEPHGKVVERGFWLFDTPCPQKLWEGVMGSNPSYFQSPDRPVEQVSWEDCQQFIERFNTLVAGLRLSLPTEAEWEYACRAGTSDATYAGPIEILGRNNAPVLDAIAWYGGNCGVEFDLEEGHPTSWPEKQHEFDKGGTRTVATKDPNPWGLYDMLGNVYEWCEDVWQSFGHEAKESQDSASAKRVVRGGSWLNDARHVRAASRHSSHPENRSNYIGFRCRVQDSEFQQERVSGGGVASAELRSRKAEPGGDSDATSEIPPAEDPGGLLGRIGKMFGRQKKRE